MGHHDFDNHTKGFWRTFVIWTKNTHQNEFLASSISDRMKVEGLIEEFGILKYFYQLYDERIEDSKPHISYRILFENEKGIRKFRIFLKKILKEYSNDYVTYTYDETNYDALQDISNAYWLGFQWLELLKDNFSIEFIRSQEFMTMVLHGLFNSAGLWKQEEIELALYYISRLMGIFRVLYKEKYWKG